METQRAQTALSLNRGTPAECGEVGKTGPQEFWLRLPRSLSQLEGKTKWLVFISVYLADALVGALLAATV